MHSGPVARCARGEKGGESTNVIYYPARVCGWDEENAKNLILIRDDQQDEFSVNLCHIVPDPEGKFVIRTGDNTCHNYDKLLSDWKRQVRCPLPKM